MRSDHVIAGKVSQYEEPDWGPLRDLVGMELADWFMWMHEIELDDGSAVHAYKHIATRCYFHLSLDGRALVYMPGGFYHEIEPRRAIDLCLRGVGQIPDRARRSSGHPEGAAASATGGSGAGLLAQAR